MPTTGKIQTAPKATVTGATSAVSVVPKQTAAVEQIGLGMGNEITIEKIQHVAPANVEPVIVAPPQQVGEVTVTAPKKDDKKKEEPKK